MCSVPVQERMPPFAVAEYYFYRDPSPLLSGVIMPAPSLAPVSRFPQQSSSEEDFSFIFILLFGITLVSALPLLLKSNGWKKDQQQDSIAKKQKDAQSILHKQLLQIYLPPYLLAVCAGWLQGPYKYALYTSYGFSQQETAYLFVAGFTSGMILGSFIGGLADYCGRKKLCICYCLIYTVSVFTKHCRYFYVLMFGRICGGIATSLLYSCFESWLICAHGERGLGGRKRVIHNNKKKEDKERWVAQSLSISMTGNSLVAIGSGILANFVVEGSGDIRPLFGTAGDGTSALYIGGYISAFDLCIVPLFLCATLIACLWKENYGEEASAFSEENHDSELFLSQGEDQQNSRFCCSIFSKKSQYQTSLDRNNGNESPKDTARETTNTNAYSLEQGITKPNLQDTEEQLESPLLLKVKVQRKKQIFSALSDGVITVWQSPNILMCCIVGSVFEGSMYIFIFLWTPTLTSLHAQLDESTTDTYELPFGMIFSSFMVSCMLGSVAFSHLSNAGVAATKCLLGVSAVAAISCLVIACPLSKIGSGATSLAKTPQYFGLLVYELCVGLYYPAMGTVKAAIVPENQRAAIYNVFRLPMNAIVLANLLCNLPYNVSFTANAILLLVACVSQITYISSYGNHV